MQLKNLGLLLGGAALAGMLLAACDGLPGDEGCTTDADCTGEGEVCHLGAKVCVATCEMGSDCPDEEKTCAAAPWTGAGTTKICQCSTDALCGRAVEGEVCSVAYKICTAGQSTTDGGMTTGCAWSACSTDSFTAAGRTCSNSSCAAGPSCSGTGQTTCAANNYCAAGACGVPVYPTQAACQNFYSGSHSGGPTWNPATSTGPVIYSVEEVSHGPGQVGTAACPNTDSVAANCQCNPGDTQWNIRIRAYRTDTAWPATRAGLSGFKYVTVGGADTDIPATLLRPQIGYENGASASDKIFNVYHCGSNANSFQPGYYFTGGNETCRQF